MFGFSQGNAEEALDALGHQAWQNLGSLKLKKLGELTMLIATKKFPSFLHKKKQFWVRLDFQVASMLLLCCWSVMVGS